MKRRECSSDVFDGQQKVLDLGAGSGLLSMLASQAGATKVSSATDDLLPKNDFMITRIITCLLKSAPSLEVFGSEKAL